MARARARPRVRRTHCSACTLQTHCARACVRTLACAHHGTHARRRVRTQALPAPVRAVLPEQLLWFADDPFGRQVFGAATVSVLLNGALFWLWARQRRKMGWQKPLWKGAKWEL